MLNYVLLLLLISQIECKLDAQFVKTKNLSLMDKIIDEFITHSAGTHLYFCKEKDAKRTLKNYINSCFIISSKVIDKVNSTKELGLNFRQPQILQIFLDLTCQPGILFLEQNTQLFNSSYHWLIWTKNYNLTMNILNCTRILTDSNVSLVVNNEGSAVQYDIYKMHKTLPFSSTKLKMWHKNGTTLKLAVPEIRNNFNGTVINSISVMKVLNYSQENFLELILDPSYKPGIDAKRRFNIRMFLYFAESFNFTPRFIYTDTWGNPIGDGKYDGMIGYIQRGEAETSGSYTLMLIPRLDAIDYLQGMSFAKTSIMFLQPQLLGSYKALTIPLHPNVWLLLFTTIIIGIVAFKIVTCNSITWGNSLLIVLSAIAQQGSENMETLASKLLHLAVLNFAFFITVYYNIAILNGLLLPVPNPIQNMNDLLASDLKIVIEENLFLRNDMLKNNDTLTNRIREKLVDAPYISDDKGLQKLRKEKIAFYNIATDFYAKLKVALTEREICALTEFDKLPKTHIGPFVQNNSPYKEIFRRRLYQFKENGMLKAQYKQWVIEKPECHWRNEKAVIKAEALTVAFAVYLFGISMSFLIGSIEVCSSKRQKKVTTDRLFIRPYIK